MRVAIIAESFLPHVNGVTGSVLRVLEHLERRGHEAMVLAPDADAGAGLVPPFVSGAPVVEMGAVGLPGYPQVRVVVGQRARIQRTLAPHAAGALAVLGGTGVAVGPRPAGALPGTGGSADDGVAGAPPVRHRRRASGPP